LTDAMIQDTCKSKTCTNLALEGLNDLKKGSQDITKYEIGNISQNDIAHIDKHINALSDKKCADAHNGASQVKVGGALLLTFALIFLSYF